MVSFWKPSCSIYIRQTINFNKINISNRHVYYPANACVRIVLISSLIDGFSRTNCQPWVHLKGVKETPLSRLCNDSICNDSTTALLLPIYSRPYNCPYERLYIVSMNGFALSLQTALRTALHCLYGRLYKRLCNGSTTALQRLCNGSTNGFVMALQMALQRLYERLYKQL